jgi:hypothetical protein
VKRLFRILLNAATLLSLAAFVTLAVFCLLGFWREWDVGWGSPTSSVSAWTSWGRVWVNWGKAHGGFELIRSDVEQGWWAGTQEKGPANATYFAGFRYHVNCAGFRVVTGDQYNGRWAVVSIPGWLAILPFMILPARYFWIRRRRKRLANANHCVSCGYDLRATPDRCPECGALPNIRAPISN